MNIVQSSTSQQSSIKDIVKKCCNAQLDSFYDSVVQISDIYVRDPTKVELKIILLRFLVEFHRFSLANDFPKTQIYNSVSDRFSAGSDPEDILEFLKNLNEAILKQEYTDEMWDLTVILATSVLRMDILYDGNQSTAIKLQDNKDYKALVEHLRRTEVAVSKIVSNLNNMSNRTQIYQSYMPIMQLMSKLIHDVKLYFMYPARFDYRCSDNR